MKKRRTSGFDYACICSSIGVCEGKYVLASLNTCSFTDTVPWLNFMLKAFIKKILSMYEFNSCHSIIQEYFPGLGKNGICWKEVGCVVLQRKQIHFSENFFGLLETVLSPTYVRVSNMALGDCLIFSSQDRELFGEEKHSSIRSNHLPGALLNFPTKDREAISENQWLILHWGLILIILRKKISLVIICAFGETVSYFISFH